MAPHLFIIPTQGHMLFKIENLLHMQLVISLSFVKLLWPFWEIHFILPWSRSRTLHIFCQLLHWKLCKDTLSIPFHKIKTPCYSWLFSPSSNDMGCKKKENWTHEGPRYLKEKEKIYGHMMVQCFSKERYPCPKK